MLGVSEIAGIRLGGKNRLHPLCVCSKCSEFYGELRYACTPGEYFLPLTFAPSPPPPRHAAPPRQAPSSGMLLTTPPQNPKTQKKRFFGASGATLPPFFHRI